MCGIVGWSGMPPDWDAAVLSRLRDVLTHRGPDGAGAFRAPEAGVALGHRRLSILDLSMASHQPMVDAGSGVVLSYNGELYNYRPLRDVLRGLGHAFTTTGDTEVVFRAYLQWGIACLERFAGMFALAVWDPRDGVLHVARDATGMKPLYYWPSVRGVAFASELKAFLALPGFHAQPNDAALHEYLEFGYSWREGHTSLRGVFKLPPGHRLSLVGGKVTAQYRWFDVPSADRSDMRDEADRVAELGAVLGEVLPQHLQADVPVGVLLSGGLDSSTVAALAARHGPVTTLCMAFADSPIDERAPARDVARYIGADHHELLIPPQQVVQELQSGAAVFDDLFADWGTVSTRLLYRHCRQRGIKVVLVGEGADELFGGYPVFEQPAQLNLMSKFRLYQRYAGRRHGRLFLPFLRTLNRYLAMESGDAFAAVRRFESRRQLPNNYVMKVDKASMAESVEARAPFLDRRVAELAWRTPREWLLRNGENKYLLRAFARQQELLPKQISGRQKFGASIAANWMETDPAFRDYARGCILAPSSQTHRLGLAGPMKVYFDKGQTGYRAPRALSLFGNLAWRLLLLERWADHYLRAA
jgi:asparagine synthase (glutamine-hydrolysing)